MPFHLELFPSAGRAGSLGKMPHSCCQNMPYRFRLRVSIDIRWDTKIVGQIDSFLNDKYLFLRSSNRVDIRCLTSISADALSGSLIERETHRDMILFSTRRCLRSLDCTHGPVQATKSSIFVVFVFF